MTTRGLRTTFTVLLLATFMASSPAISARPSQKAALVTVVAESSGPLRELQTKDFVVKEDGAKREVLDARLADEPLSIALLIDTTQPPMGAAPPTQDLRAAGVAFVRAVHRVEPEAQISLAEFAGAAVTTVPFTSNLDDLEKVIVRLYPNQQGIAVLLEALADAGKKLATRPAPRRAIVSVDFNSPEGSADRAMKDAVNSVHDAGATLWALSVRGTAPTIPNREDVLNKVTKANGGLRLSSVDPSGLEGMLKNVAASLTSQYIVTFARPGEGTPKATTFETVGGGKVLLTPFMR